MMQAASPVRLKVSELMPLSVKSNLPAVLRSLGHLGAIVLTAAVLWPLHGTWWAVPLTLLLGYLIAFLFSVLHETAHQTAFRHRAGNYLMGHLAGFALVYPYEYYRAFHWDHHRYTQDPERDPELFIPLAKSTLGLLWYLGGLPTWFARIRMLVTHGLAARVDEPWIPAHQRPLIIAEARWYLAGYAILIVSSVVAQSMLLVWLWVVPVMTGVWFLRLYLLSEHTGCPHSTDMLQNTRTTYTNGFVRFFAWNMPYHAEHHAYPAVPFHALPQLNQKLAAHIANTEGGYIDSVTAVWRYLAERDKVTTSAR